jgi:TonB family protein
MGGWTGGVQLSGDALGALLLSLAAHGALGLWLVEAPTKPAIPLARPLTTIKVAVVKPVAPAPQPVEPPPEAPPAPKPATPAVSRSKSRAASPRSRPDMNRRLPDSDPVPGGAVPVALPSLGLSNFGLVVGAAGPGPIGTGGRSTPSPARTSKPAQPRARAWTPLSDLSSRPRPPRLGATLSRNYPRSLRQQGVEGQALVSVLLTRNGQVEQAEIVSESAVGFGQACRKSLLESQWSTPRDKAGRAARTRLRYRCRFQVEQ